MKKIWAIVWKELYTTFTDRTLILIMVASPLMLSTIVALAFGGLGSGDSPIEDIPVAIVNLDQPGPAGIAYGDTFVSVLVPEAAGQQPASDDGLASCETTNQAGSASGGMSLDQITEAVVFDRALADFLIDAGQLEFQHDVADLATYTTGAAKAAVDRGIYTAAIIVPEDFSQRISYIPVVHPDLEPSAVEVYANSGSPIAAGVVRSIAEAITNQIATGNIAVAATFAELQASGGMTILAEASQSDLSAIFACAFTPAGNTVSLDAESVQESSTENPARAILVLVGSGQAMFFALFTAQFGVLGLHNERRQWTLQRMVISPTPRSLILAGNLAGVFVVVLLQLGMLILALTLVGSILQGKLDLIWGDNLVLIVGLLLSVALSVAGFGMLMASIAKTPEQGQILAPITSMAMGVVGGAFGFTLPRAVSIFSIVYWGREAFQTLAAGESGIGLNLAVLLIQGVVMYVVGVWLFNRRFEVA
jgi:ABC-type transport system involved in multi-copper enzyme maturation permease subunit